MFIHDNVKGTDGYSTQITVTNYLQLALLFGTTLQQNALFLTQSLQVGNV